MDSGVFRSAGRGESLAMVTSRDTRCSDSPSNQQVKKYIDIGFEVDEKQVSYPCQTALHHAASGGRMDVLRYLVKRRANIALVDDNGNSE